MGLCYEQKGMYEEAIAAYRKANRLSGNNWVLAALGRAYAGAGRRREAQEALHKLIKDSGRREFSPYSIARIYVALGDKERAFDWLERAYEGRDERMVILKVDWKLDDLRVDPRFKELLRRMNLAQ